MKLNVEDVTDGKIRVKPAADGGLEVWFSGASAERPGKALALAITIDDRDAVDLRDQLDLALNTHRR